MSLINTELVRANPRLDGLDRKGLKDLIRQAKEALKAPRHKISDDYYVAGNVMLFAENHSTDNYDSLPQEGQDLIDQFDKAWFYDQICSYPFSGHSAGDGYSLKDVLKQYKFVKKCIDEFIKAAEEAKRLGADTVVRCNADKFHYDTLEGYEDD